LSFLSELDIFHRLRTKRREKSGSEKDQHREEPTGELFSTAGEHRLKTVAEGEYDTAE
jgi:hypothetical protein